MRLTVTKRIRIAVAQENQYIIRFLLFYYDVFQFSTGQLIGLCVWVFNVLFFHIQHFFFQFSCCVVFLYFIGRIVSYRNLFAPIIEYYRCVTSPQNRLFSTLFDLYPFSIAKNNDLDHNKTTKNCFITHTIS